MNVPFYEAMLASFLQTHYAQDYLMPVPPGTKHPRFPHRDGAWSWKHYHNYNRMVASARQQQQQRHRRKKLKLRFLSQPEPSPSSQPPSASAVDDVAVLLHDLCVVDVDDRRLAAELEEAWPILKTAPCEDTAKGRHYWFERPAVADIEGFYDGAAQVRRGVDFKSVCETGTSGVVVVAPSTGKTWVRSLWTTPVPELPEDLLRAIARPRHPAGAVTKRPLRLVFEDGHVMGVEGRDIRWLHAMSYFEPLIESGDACDVMKGSDECGLIPVPCQEDEFRALLHVLQCDSMDCFGAAASGALLVSWHQRLIQLADKLGLCSALLRRLSTTGETSRQVDMALLSPLWWAAHCEEKQWVHSGVEGGLLRRLDAAAAAHLRYVKPEAPEALAQTWLIRPPRQDAIPPGSAVLCANPDEDVPMCLPEEVMHLLRLHPGRLVLCGGGALGSVCPWAKEGSDWDIFVVGMTREEADQILREIWAAADDAGLDVLQTSNAATIITKEDVRLQLILRLHDSIESVLLSFDIAPARVAVFWDDAQQQWAVVATPSCVAALQHMAFPVELGHWSASMALRVLKYQGKGFDVALPGTRRAAFVPTPLLPRYMHMHGGHDGRGLRALFFLESMLSQSMSRSNHARVDQKDLRACYGMVKDAPHSNYEEALRWTDRLVWAVRSMVRRMQRLLPGRRVVQLLFNEAQQLDLLQVVWQVVPRPRTTGQTTSSSRVRLAALYDLFALQRELSVTHQMLIGESPLRQ